MGAPPNKAAAMQREHVAAAKRKHEKDVASFKDELKEDAARGIFSMKLTEKQMCGLPVTLTVPRSISIKPKRWISACCKKPASNYRSLYVGGSVQRFFHCKECGKECEATEKR